MVKQVWIGMVPPELVPKARELCQAVIVEYPTARVGITDRWDDDNLRFSFVMLSEKWGKELCIDCLLSSTNLEYWQPQIDALRGAIEYWEKEGPPLPEGRVTC